MKQYPENVCHDTRTINTFVPTPLMRTAEQGGTATPGKFPTIERVLLHALGEEESAEAFKNWGAVILQHRVKTLTSWILQGTFGTGKGVIFHHILAPMLGPYARFIMSNSLRSDFTAWRENTLLIFIDEMEADMFSSDNKRVEQVIKTIITEPTADINRKGISQYTRPSYESYIMASNSDQPVRLHYKDRRFQVGAFQHDKIQLTPEEIYQVIPSELPHFAHYLLTRKADIIAARTPIENEQRREMQALSMTSADEVALALNTGDFDKLHEWVADESVTNYMNDNVSTLYNQMIRQWGEEAVSKVSREQLAVIFQHTIGTVPDGKNKFTMFLRHKGLKTKKVRINNEVCMGVEIEWQNTPFKQEYRASLNKRSTKLRAVN
jgi:hypothetical protein